MMCVCIVFVGGAIVVLLFFFFFKQKTAYEMRISDWSSDVCSSDLTRRASATRPRGGSSISPICAIPTATNSAAFTRFRADMAGDRGQIGRASCRERVCQYV